MHNLRNNFEGDRLLWHDEARKLPLIYDFFEAHKAIDVFSIFDFILYGAVLPPHAPLLGVRQLFPGEMIKNGERTNEYVNLDLTVRPRNIATMAAEFQKLLAEYFASFHDTESAVLLSGGIDSAIIASFLGSRATAFTWGGWGEQSTDVRYAKETRKTFGLKEHHFVYADYKKDHEGYRKAVEALGIPLLFHNAVPHIRLAQAAAERGVKSWFMGQNADTVLVSYPAPIIIRRLIRLKKILPINPLHLWKRKGFLFSTASVVRLFAYFKSSGVFPGPWIKVPHGYFEEKEEIMRRYVPRGTLMQKIILIEELLTEARRNQIHQNEIPRLYNIDVRCPYYTRKFIEFALSLPDGARRKDHYGKAVFKELARLRGVPDVVIEKGKKGLSYGYKEFMARKMHIPIWDVMEKDDFMNHFLDMRKARAALQDNFLAFDVLRSLYSWGEWVAKKRGLKL
ncbi:MAG: asparagine synthase [Candidatus Sungbacteria bacterium]|nr:asparagine synthase [Candidatus Sungbacteria bacterium]